MRPYKCPVCYGQGIVSKPPWISGDIHIWGGADTSSYECKACSGRGILWCSDVNDYPDFEDTFKKHWKDILL
jgi:hypothetical protein